MVLSLRYNRKAVKPMYKMFVTPLSRISWYFKLIA